MMPGSSRLAEFCCVLVAVVVSNSHVLSAPVESPMDVVAEAISQRRATSPCLRIAARMTSTRPEKRNSLGDIEFPAAEYDTLVTSVIDVNARRLRLEKKTSIYDSELKAMVPMWEVIGFDGSEAVSWYPEELKVGDGGAVVQVSRMGDGVGFLNGRAIGPEFWWLGLLDDYDSFISGQPTNLQKFDWALNGDSGEITARLIKGETEQEFVFAEAAGWNVVKATIRLLRGENPIILAETSVEYSPRESLFVPINFTRRFHEPATLDMQEYTEFSYSTPLPIEETRLPEEHLQPDMLVSGYHPGLVSSVSKEGIPVPVRPIPGTQLNPSLAVNWLNWILVGIIALIFLVAIWRRDRRAVNNP
ncbi:MAG: hypothetical protein KDA96_14375 [Planctomycetaceae bacterium]|nr:hypothetical protein [Planctomycetaceae bacterium]